MNSTNNYLIKSHILEGIYQNIKNYLKLRISLKFTDL